MPCHTHPSSFPNLKWPQGATSCPSGKTFCDVSDVTSPLIQYAYFPLQPLSLFRSRYTQGRTSYSLSFLSLLKYTENHDYFIPLVICLPHRGISRQSSSATLIIGPHSELLELELKTLLHSRIAIIYAYPTIQIQTEMLACVCFFPLAIQSIGLNKSSP